MSNFASCSLFIFEWVHKLVLCIESLLSQKTVLKAKLYFHIIVWGGLFFNHYVRHFKTYCKIMSSLQFLVPTTSLVFQSPDFSQQPTFRIKTKQILHTYVHYIFPSFQPPLPTYTHTFSVLGSPKPYRIWK